jgi:hypothetical protein
MHHIKRKIFCEILTFELPGGPTITKGVKDRAHTNVMKIFSFNPSVKAILSGISVSL